LLKALSLKSWKKMTDPAKPARRRIIPQQIFSPTKSHAESEGGAPTTAVSQLMEIGDLKEHSHLACTLLGAGRKIYVDLAKYQKEERSVNWKEVSLNTPQLLRVCLCDQSINCFCF